MTVIASSVFAVVGLYLTHSLRRQQSLRIAQQRIDSYRKLWELLEVARRTRVHSADGEGPLTREEAHKLFRDLARWYYRSGNGMLLSNASLALYTEVRRRLGDYAVGKGTRDGVRCMDDISLLRQQMRFDLKTISGRPAYWEKLNPDDEDLLEAAGIRNSSGWAPWYRRLYRRRTFREPQPDPPSPRSD